jgi:hypothetical protein
MKKKNKYIISFVIIFICLLVFGYIFARNARLKARKYSDMRMMVNTLFFSIRMYQQANGELPPDLGALMDEGFLEEKFCYISFNSDTIPPKNGDDIRKGQCDYLYFGKDRKLVEKWDGKKYLGCFDENGKAFPLLALKLGIYKNYFIYTTSVPEAKESKSPPSEILKLIKELEKK